MSRTPQTAQQLVTIAREARWLVIKTVTACEAGHVGGPLSAMEILVALYFAQLNIDPAVPAAPERDRFILSKGHCAIGLYAVLALRGYFPIDELKTFDRGNSRLQGHPDMKLTPGVDASSGSLGQGLSAGAGMALGAQRLGRDFHTWVLIGDGELQEGMIWEAIYSVRRFGLDNLTAIVDLNGLQQYGWPRGADSDRFDRSDPWEGVNLETVFDGFGWNVLCIDGHDFDEILASFAAVERNRGSGKPSVILARTTKGKGISFTEGAYKWHNGTPTSDELRTAAFELGQSANEIAT